MRSMDDATTSTGFFLTVGAAAQQAGVAKSTLTRAIRSGKLSAQRCPDTNSFKVDPAELHRYCEATRIVRSQHSAPPVQPAEPTLATQVQVLEVQLTAMKTLVDELRGDRDAWRAQAERLGLALPRPEERRGLWRRWLKRAG